MTDTNASELRAQPEMTGNADIITPAQCRAARALISMSQEELSRFLDLSRLSINTFEAGKRILTIKHRTALREALEKQGVMFIDADAYGTGVRFRSPYDK